MDSLCESLRRANAMMFVSGALIHLLAVGALAVTLQGCCYKCKTTRYCTEPRGVKKVFALPEER